MAALEFLSHPLWQRLTFTLLHFCWQGALIALALAAILALTRSAQNRYFLALVALFALVLAPVATALWLEAPVSTSPILAKSTTSLDIAQYAYESAALTELATDTFAASVASWQPYVIAAWLFGVLGLSLRLLVSYLGVQRLRGQTTRLDGVTQATANRLARIMRVSTLVEVKASELVREALVVGLWRPLVLMPTSWLTELEPHVLEAVIAHELAHVRRHDLWVNLLQRVLETLLFYQPGVWYVSRVLRVEREKCCDELAVAATGQRVAYVEALELVALRRLAASPSVWATAMGGAKKMNLLERVRNVLGLSPTTNTARYWPVGVAALVLPASLYCASLAFAPAAQADDAEKKEGDRPAVKREGDRVDGPRREGDRPRPEGERREGDRPRPEGERREGDRPRPEGERRDGDRPRPEGDRPRPDGPRPDGPPREGGPRHDGDRPFPPRGEMGPVPPELMRLIAELRAEVTQLRREVNQLREGRGPGREGGPRPDGPPRREGDRPRPEGGPRPDGPPREGGPRPDGPRPDGPRREGDRPRPEGERRPDGPRPEGDRPRPDGERRPDVEKKD